MMAISLFGHHAHGIMRPSLKNAHGRGFSSSLGRKFCPLVRAAIQPSERQNQKDGDARAPNAAPSASSWQRVLAGAATGFCAWSATTLPAWAGVDPETTILGPSTNDLLSAGPDFSFTTLLMFTLLGYWFVKAVMYLSMNSPTGPEQPDDKQQQQQQDRPGSGSGGLNDIGHAHIRSYVDSSQPGPGGEADARELRNASLARSAAYRVLATLRESQPRIHHLVEELTAPQPQWPPRAPRNADVDPVAALVYDRVLQERSAKGPEYVLGARELAALETRLLEEVAERVAADQVADFIKMAAKGTLHPRRPGSGGGADQQPHSHAH